jgi:hypothetical protein
LSKYKVKPIELEGLKTYPLKSRESKVHISDFAAPWVKGEGMADFFRRLPNILGGAHLRKLIQSIIDAKKNNKSVIMAMGAHPIKCGLSPVIIDLFERGVINALAMNGAGIIHDIEIALVGHTSEQVESSLEKGEFGMAKETGEIINKAINWGARRGLGIGEALGNRIYALAPPFGEKCIVLQAYKHNIPVTVHVAIGTDITHFHPLVNGAAIGKASHRDFRLFCSLINQLNQGGVFINVGSAVILPEVFLKALSLMRNKGYELKNFITANFDQYTHYRPDQNVVKRPKVFGGWGTHFIGQHEIMLPLLAAILIEMLPGKENKRNHNNFIKEEVLNGSEDT